MMQQERGEYCISAMLMLVLTVTTTRGFVIERPNDDDGRGREIEEAGSWKDREHFRLHSLPLRHRSGRLQNAIDLIESERRYLRHLEQSLMTSSSDSSIEYNGDIDNRHDYNTPTDGSSSRALDSHGEHVEYGISNKHVENTDESDEAHNSALEGKQYLYFDDKSAANEEAAKRKRNSERALVEEDVFDEELNGEMRRLVLPSDDRHVATDKHELENIFNSASESASSRGHTPSAMATALLHEGDNLEGAMSNIKSSEAADSDQLSSEEDEEDEEEYGNDDHVTNLPKRSLEVEEHGANPYSVLARSAEAQDVETDDDDATDKDGDTGVNKRTVATATTPPEAEATAFLFDLQQQSNMSIRLLREETRHLVMALDYATRAQTKHNKARYMEPEVKHMRQALSLEEFLQQNLEGVSSTPEAPVVHKRKVSTADTDSADSSSRSYSNEAHDNVDKGREEALAENTEEQRRASTHAQHIDLDDASQQRLEAAARDAIERELLNRDAVHPAASNVLMTGGEGNNRQRALQVYNRLAQRYGHVRDGKRETASKHRIARYIDKIFKRKVSIDRKHSEEFTSSFDEDADQCPSVMQVVDNCRFASDLHLDLDDDALELCNRHQLCYSCGAEHEQDAQTCDLVFMREARRRCEDEKDVGRCHLLALAFYDVMRTYHVFMPRHLTRHSCQALCTAYYL